ncbi:MAG: DUF4265 domain-containing protein [Bacteroidetes bacterium]|nr:DUF4265 domain-containing protein [Bacteroidota bacterium]
MSRTDPGIDDSRWRKVFFRLEPDEDGYPPASCESMWAIELANGHYRIENIPFFAVGVSYGDVVEAQTTTDSLDFVRVVSPSKHSTIRLIVFDSAKVAAVREKVSSFGCDSERSHLPRLIAIDVPPQADIAGVDAFLIEGIEDGMFDVEMSNVWW